MKERQVEILPCPFAERIRAVLQKKGRSSIPKPVKR